jgi:hypothetical protein
MLSERIAPKLEPSPIFEYMSRVIDNAFDEVNNPEGVITLGIDENTLMSKELSEFLSIYMKITPDVFERVSPSPALITGLLNLYNNPPFNPAVPVEGKHLYFTADSAQLMEQLFWTFCDEGEGVLIRGPSCADNTADIAARCKIKPIYVCLKDVDPFSLEAVRRYEQELIRSGRNGVTASVLILSQPHNFPGQYTPLLHRSDRRCYPRETIIEYMRLCQTYQIHFISNETYALTTFSTDDVPNPTPFTSILNIDKTDIIDPGLCHVVHDIGNVCPVVILLTIVGFLF